MNHHSTSVWHYISSIFVLLLLSTIGCANEQQEAQVYTEGKHYIALTDDVKENDVVENFRRAAESKVQVVAFFSYGCSWCYKLEPVVENWVNQAPDYVVFERVPVEFQPSWRTLTKAYYTAVNLNALDKIHHPLFKAIHTDELTDSSEETLKTFFTEQGVTAEDFDATFDSFAVNRKQKWANSLSQAFRITAIPSILVQGPTGAYLTSVRMAGGEDGLIKVMNYLVEKQHLAAQEQKPTEESVTE